MDISSFEVVCFSGSRATVPPALFSIFHEVHKSARIYVGCASGVDSAVRVYFHDHRQQVFEASRFGVGKSSFVRRSVACVEAAAGCRAFGERVLFVAAPARACPSGFAFPQSPRWVSCGSGSWSSLGLAVAHGLPCIVVAGSRSWLPVPPLFCEWEQVEGSIYTLTK